MSTTMPAPAQHGATDLEALRAVENRVLWLATAIVDHANRVRPNAGGLKVGGHQASSASIVSIMTALWFGALRPEDRVSVKPHASPVLHAINHLLGQLDARYLTTLREKGGLQSYPSRSKDPDPVDYSTGSVGIGATAPIWGAIARRYAHGVGARSGSRGILGRQFSLVGDAELDEGAVWEAVLDPMVRELGEVCWVVDFNRQSLDRVVPDISVTRLHGLFDAAGWQVITVKYGRLLEDLYTRDGGAALRRRIDAMTNPEYQRLLRCTAAQLRERIPGEGSHGAPRRSREDRRAARDDRRRRRARRDPQPRRPRPRRPARRLRRASTTPAPRVVFAYTVKGYGLASQGHPQNHSSLLTEAQMRELADHVGADLDDPWRPAPPDSDAARLCADAAARLNRAQDADARRRHPPCPPTPDAPRPAPAPPSRPWAARCSTSPARPPRWRARLVTVAPDVASSTNLGGWLNKVGTWSPRERRDWFDDDAETILHWRERPTGRHIELGIAETNLVGLLGELGATWSRWGEPLLPIGVLYDPFVARALEPWAFGMYAGGQSILVGTPSGVSLAPEGGAHQSITTPSIGLEQPGCVAFEPAFAVEVTWCLLDGLARLGRPDGSSTYLRLSTAPGRPVPRRRAHRPRRPRTTPPRRRRRRLPAAPRRAPAAGDDRRHGRDRPAALGRRRAARRARRARRRRRRHQRRPALPRHPGPGRDGDRRVLEAAFPADRAAPLVTVLDGHPHTLAFLAGVHRVQARHLGVTTFGQSSDLASAYAIHGIDADGIVTAALDGAEGA